VRRRTHPATRFSDGRSTAPQDQPLPHDASRLQHRTRRGRSALSSSRSGAARSLFQRAYIGGVATNTIENLVHWIVNPKDFSPKTVLRATGIRSPRPGMARRTCWRCA